MERRRRNVSSDVDVVEVFGAYRIPAAKAHWHPSAAMLYRSLSRSGQSALMEPSDWAYAQHTAEMHTDMLTCPGTGVQLGQRHRQANVCPVCLRPIEKDQHRAFVRHWRIGTVRAGMLDLIDKSWNELGVTESARRRARIEVVRKVNPDGPAKVSAMDTYRQRLGPTAPKPPTQEGEQ